MSRSAPLVLVHGDPETAAIWNPFLRLLGRDGVVTLSPPGFGTSLPRPSTLRRRRTASGSRPASQRSAGRWISSATTEESVRQLFGGDPDRRRRAVAGLGITGDAGEAVAAAMDPDMRRAVLSLLRSAAQPA